MPLYLIEKKGMSKKAKKELSDVISQYYKKIQNIPLKSDNLRTVLIYPDIEKVKGKLTIKGYRIVENQVNDMSIGCGGPYAIPQTEWYVAVSELDDIK